MYKYLCIVFLNFNFLALKMFSILLKASWNFQTNALSTSAPNQGWTVSLSSSVFLCYKYHSHFCHLDTSTSQTLLKGKRRHHSIHIFFHFVALSSSDVAKQCLRFHVGEITICTFHYMGNVHQHLLHKKGWVNGCEIFGRLFLNINALYLSFSEERLDNAIFWGCFTK